MNRSTLPTGLRTLKNWADKGHGRGCGCSYYQQDYQGLYPFFSSLSAFYCLCRGAGCCFPLMSSRGELKKAQDAFLLFFHTAPHP